MLVLSAVLGGGVSSRLFQRVREELGLVYSIYTSPSSYPGCGDFSIVAAASPRNTRKVLGEIAREQERLLSRGLGQEELQQAKAQLNTAFVLAQESAYARMSAMGGSLLVQGKPFSLGRTLRGIDLVTEQKVMKLARQVFEGPMSLAVVGPRPERFL